MSQPSETVQAGRALHGAHHTAIISFCSAPVLPPSIFPSGLISRAPQASLHAGLQKAYKTQCSSFGAVSSSEERIWRALVLGRDTGSFSCPEQW